MTDWAEKQRELDENHPKKLKDEIAVLKTLNASLVDKLVKLEDRVKQLEAKK
jgi:hypothetical protein